MITIWNKHYNEHITQVVGRYEDLFYDLLRVIKSRAPCSGILLASGKYDLMRVKAIHCLLLYRINSWLVEGHLSSIYLTSFGMPLMSSDNGQNREASTRANDQGNMIARVIHNVSFPWHVSSFGQSRIPLYLWRIIRVRLDSMYSNHVTTIP